MGGYQILDFKKYDFHTTRVTTKAEHGLSIYEKIEATNKRTVVTNLVIGEVEYDDMEVHFKSSSGAFVGTVYVGAGSVQFNITALNTITITVTA